MNFTGTSRVLHRHRPQDALRDEAFEHEGRDFAGWDRATAEQYFVAGGGDSGAFEEAWRRERLRVTQIATALRETRYYANATGVFYFSVGPRAAAMNRSDAPWPKNGPRDRTPSGADPS